jgi:hypothetical protein
MSLRCDYLLEISRTELILSEIVDGSNEACIKTPAADRSSPVTRALRIEQK